MNGGAQVASTFKELLSHFICVCFRFNGQGAVETGGVSVCDRRCIEFHPDIIVEPR